MTVTDDDREQALYGMAHRLAISNEAQQMRREGFDKRFATYLADARAEGSAHVVNDTDGSVLVEVRLNELEHLTVELSPERETFELAK